MTPEQVAEAKKAPPPTARQGTIPHPRQHAQESGSAQKGREFTTEEGSSPEATGLR